MKKHQLFITAISVIFIFGCSNIENKGDKLPDQIILTKGEATTATLSNETAFDLLSNIEKSQLKKGERESVIVSPLSFSMMMAMLWNGAAGRTREDIKRGLGFENLSDEDVNNYFKKILDVLPSTDPKTKVSIANSIWYQNGYTLKENFIDINNRYFNAEISPIDFTSPRATDIINTWCSNKTNGMIDKIADQLPRDLAAMLINALYFKGKWSNQFDVSDTKKAPFYTAQGEKEVNMMYQNNTFYAYSNELYESISLPYGNNAFSMTIILPRESIASTLDHLDANSFWNDLIIKQIPGNYNLYLPKFKLEYEVDLKDYISEAGMDIIFSSDADFSNMMGGICVSKVMQKAVIRTDEEGTEAAAVTAGMMATSLPPTFRIDRPFIFIISENTSSTILFIGKVEDPS